MLKMYLLVFVFLLIAIQPSIVKLFNSSTLGRFMLISAIIFCTTQNHLAGLALTVLVIVVLNETGPENFDTYNAEGEEEEGEEITEDNEMIEKKMITPLSSYNVMPVITPDNVEPESFDEVESFSAY
jgi:hypothetical protein